nr:Lipoprotein signal peptidase [Ipomoea batatas]
MGNYAGNVGRRIIQLVISCMFLWPSSLLVQGTFDRETLDSFVGQHALKNASNRRTGRLYDVVLPANFSGMEASVVRFRTGSLWKRGANFSLFRIPPNILPVPFMRRMHIVFANLGNWSSSYYSVSNHTLVAPVVGLLGYDADMANSSSLRRIEDFRLRKDPILVHFPNNISLPNMKCVRFGINGGTIEFSNVTVDGLCVARGQGHFTLVIPTPEEEEKKKKKKGAAAWKWWAVGFGVGVMGLIFVGIMIMMYRVVKQKRVGRMEKQSEKSEALDTMWIGRSRMPYATRIRTEPVLEDSYVP